MELKGQVALVTGAGRGIGRACALALAAAGADVAVHFRQDRTAAATVAAEVEAMGRRAPLYQADVGDAGACEALVTAVVQRLGRLDILVNNAGTALDKLLIDTTADEWDAQMAVHLRGMYACSRAALQPMSAQRYGRIITVSSIWGLSGAANEVAYSTAKAGQIGFTKALAQEVGRWGITVNALAPGWIDTDMNKGADAEDVAEWVGRTPVGRLGTAAEVAAVVCFLAGPAAGFITGQVWSPNGGIVT